MEATHNTSKSSRVLANYELVEHILSYLDFLDLIHAYQVSKQWRSIAIRSQLLRHHLYLELRSHDSTPRQWRSDRSSSGIARIIGRPLNANPILRYSPRFGFDAFPCEISLRYNDVVRMLNWQSGIWEDMLMSIPPPRKVVIRIGGARWSGDYGTIENQAGIRLGEVRSRMLALLRVKGGLELKEDLMRKVEMLGLRVHIYED